MHDLKWPINSTHIVRLHTWHANALMQKRRLPIVLAALEQQHCDASNARCMQPIWSPRRRQQQHHRLLLQWSRQNLCVEPGCGDSRLLEKVPPRCYSTPWRAVITAWTTSAPQQHPQMQPDPGKRCLQSSTPATRLVKGCMGHIRDI